MRLNCIFGAIVAMAFLLVAVPTAAEPQNDTLAGVFSQKGGMLLPGDHSVYLRTNDEWTGFSTFYLGYRYGVNRTFNIAVEAAASAIPHVYLVGLLTHWRFFESADHRVFIGLRTRTGYRYQDSDFSTPQWEGVVGEDYLVLKRNGVYLAADLTVALRFGQAKRHCVYYTIYPRADIDFKFEQMDARRQMQLHASSA